MSIYWRRGPMPFIGSPKNSTTKKILNCWKWRWTHQRVVGNEVKGVGRNQIMKDFSSNAREPGTIQNEHRNPFWISFPNIPSLARTTKQKYSGTGQTENTWITLAPVVSWDQILQAAMLWLKKKKTVNGTNGQRSVCLCALVCDWVCVCVSLFMCVPSCVSVNICLCVCLCALAVTECMFMCVSVYMCAFVYVYEYVSACVCVHWCVIECVCICVSVYVCLRVCLWICLCVCLCVSTYTCVFPCVFTCMCVLVCISVSVNVSLCLWACLGMCVSVCVSACVCVCVSVCMCLCMWPVEQLWARSPIISSSPSEPDSKKLQETACIKFRKSWH